MSRSRKTPDTDTPSMELVTTTPDLSIMPRVDAATIWQGFRDQLEALKETADTLTVTDVSQVEEIKLARTTRITLKNIRCAVEARRKELGDGFLKAKQSIDSDAKALKEFCELREDRLLEMEQFAERKEAERIAEIVKERQEAVAYFDGQVFGVDFAVMSEADFDKYLATCEAAQNFRKAEEARIAAEKEAKEKAEAEERERIRLENERLMAEAKEREAILAKEREEHSRAALAREEELFKERQAAKAAQDAAAAILAKERAEAAAREKEARDAADKEKARLEAIASKAEAQRREWEAEAERKRVADEEEAARIALAEKRAAAAPDKEKLLQFAASVRNFLQPVCKSEDGKRVAEEIAQKTANFANWIEKLVKESL